MTKRILFTGLFLAMAAAGTGWACASRTSANDLSSAREASGKREDRTMKLRLKLKGREITATLADNETARDFASLLPLTLTLRDYASTEKISDLPRKLSTKGSPEGSTPTIGDITYYAPWGNLAIFHKDFGYSSGLIKLGQLDSGVEALSAPGPLKVIIERLEKMTDTDPFRR